MATRKIVSMPGDGIGNTVLPEAIRVLSAAGFEAEYIPADIGWEFWIKEGNALPQRTIDLLAEHKLGLFGAITSKPKDKAAAEISPALKDKGYVYYSPIVGLRQHFDLDLCIRPCRSFKGNPLNFIRRKNGGFEELYDLRNDPHELTDLTSETAYRKQKKELKAAAIEWIQKWSDPDIFLDGDNRFRKFPYKSTGYGTWQQHPCPFARLPWHLRRPLNTIKEEAYKNWWWKACGGDMSQLLFYAKELVLLIRT